MILEGQQCETHWAAHLAEKSEGETMGLKRVLETFMPLVPQ